MEEHTFDDVTIQRIATVLNKRRNALGLTLQQVGDMVNMSRANVSNLMSGKHTYPTLILVQVARALGWSWMQLAFEVERPPVIDSPDRREIAALVSEATTNRNNRSARPSET